MSSTNPMVCPAHGTPLVCLWTGSDARDWYCPSCRSMPTASHLTVSESGVVAGPYCHGCWAKDAEIENLREEGERLTKRAETAEGMVAGLAKAADEQEEGKEYNARLCESLRAEVEKVTRERDEMVERWKAVLRDSDKHLNELGRERAKACGERDDARAEVSRLTAEVAALKAGTGTGECLYAYALSSGGQTVAVLAGSVAEAVRIGLPRLREWIRYDQGDFGDLVAIVCDDMGSPDDVLIQATESAEAEAGEGGGK